MPYPWLGLRNKCDNHVKLQTLPSGGGISWLEMIYQWRPQNIVKMPIVLIASPDIRRGSNQSIFRDHLTPIFRLSQIWDMELWSHLVTCRESRQSLILVLILSNNISNINTEIGGGFSILVLEELKKTGYYTK